MHIMCDYFYMRNKLVKIGDPNRLACYGPGTIIPFVLFCISFFCLWMGSLFFTFIPLSTCCKLGALIADFVLMIGCLMLGRKNSLSDKTMEQLKEKQSEYSRHVRGLLLAFLTENDANSFLNKYTEITKALDNDVQYNLLEKGMKEKASFSKTRLRLLNDEILADRKRTEGTFTVSYVVCFVSVLLSSVRSAVENISTASSEEELRNRILVQITIMLVLLLGFVIVLFSRTFVEIFNKKKVRNLGNAHYELELLLSDDNN